MSEHRELDIKQHFYDSQLSIPENQIRRIEFPLTRGTVNYHQQAIKDDMSEFMITGLRLTGEGIYLRNFYQRFGRELMDVYGNEIEALISLGLLERTNRTSEVIETSEVLRLTSRGRLLGNQVFLRFV